MKAMILFPRVIQYLQENNISLAGAEYDFNCPETGKAYIFSLFVNYEHKPSLQKLMPCV
ncbi:hypothetical protein REC12_18825 [Desulfosporosinus sp. PR]|nr:hypothetical protein [Desulfosporosinus sp. PR]